MKRVTRTLIKGLVFAALAGTVLAQSIVKTETLHTRAGDFAFETSVLHGIPTQESSEKLFNLRVED